MSTLIEAFARTIDAYTTCRARAFGDPEDPNVENARNWVRKHEEKIRKLESCLPHGSGIDTGMHVVLDDSIGENVVIGIPYHHMNGNGFYVGWNSYTATVTPSLLHGFTVDIRCEDDSADVSFFDREHTMDYLADILSEALNEEIDA